MAHPADLTRLLKAERAAEKRLRAARDNTDAALRSAHEATGISYGQMAKITGLTAETVRSRITQPHVTAREARQAELGRLMKAKPSVSAAEAARRLGTSRTQITVMLGDGRLHEVEYKSPARRRFAAMVAEGKLPEGAVFPGHARKRIAMDSAWDAAVKVYDQKANRHRQAT